MSDFAFLGCGIVLTGLFGFVVDMRLQEGVNRISREVEELHDRIEMLENGCSHSQHLFAVYIRLRVCGERTESMRGTPNEWREAIDAARGAR